MKIVKNMKEANKHLIALTQEKEELFYKILENNGGHIANACKEIGISTGTYKNHYGRNASFGNRCSKIITKMKLSRIKNKPAKIIIKKEAEKTGRPTMMTPETIKKLKEAFSQGFSIDNACIWAEISKQTFYTYCEKEEGFLDYCKALKQKPLIKSILVINKALNEGDVSTAKWYAERKAKDEFSLRQEITGEDGEPIKMQVPEITVNFVKKNED
jgi:flagellar biosynthesis/type III secretory pathway chaperone